MRKIAKIKIEGRVNVQYFKKFALTKYKESDFPVQYSKKEFEELLEDFAEMYNEGYVEGFEKSEQYQKNRTDFNRFVWALVLSSLALLFSLAILIMQW